MTRLLSEVASPSVRRECRPLGRNGRGQPIFLLLWGEGKRVRCQLRSVIGRRLRMGKLNLAARDSEDAG